MKLFKAGMTLQEKIDNVKAQKIQMTVELDALLLSIKTEFEAHIIDKTVPLIERWNFWINAPDDLKYFSSTIPYPSSDIFNQILCDEDKINHKYEEINVADRLENVVYDNKLHPEEYNITMPQLIDLLEEIVAMNLYSFKYDW